MCVSVEDSGSGMDQDTMGRIFEPFFSTKGPGKGTGLGLSVVYGIVKQHKGWIYTLSTPRMGTTFEVYLPTAGSAPDAKPSAHEVQLGQQASGERILVVEDEASVRDLAATILRKNGYEVFEAPNVAEALRIYEQEDGRFDLVFSDVVLPDRSGVQLADELLERAPGTSTAHEQRARKSPLAMGDHQEQGASVPSEAGTHCRDCSRWSGRRFSRG